MKIPTSKWVALDAMHVREGDVVNIEGTYKVVAFNRLTATLQLWLGFTDDTEPVLFEHHATVAVLRKQEG